MFLKFTVKNTRKKFSNNCIQKDVVFYRGVQRISHNFKEYSKHFSLMIGKIPSLLELVRVRNLNLWSCHKFQHCNLSKLHYESRCLNSLSSSKWVVMEFQSIAQKVVLLTLCARMTGLKKIEPENKKF